MAPGSPARRRHRGLGWLLVLILVVVLVAAYFITDAVLRRTAEARVAAQISDQLPKSIDGHPSVSIGGFSVIAQYLTGSFDTIAVDAPNATVTGKPVAVHIVAHGVPVDRTKPVKVIQGTIRLGQGAVNALIDIPGSSGTISLGDGDVSYSGTASALGLSLDYTVTAMVKANGDAILLTPSQVKLGRDSVDVSGVLGKVAKTPVPICVAKYLPQGVGVTDVAITPGRALVTLRARDLVLTEGALGHPGSCT